ncbi:MAG: carboxypeptidase-like regulatory domain-containing protein [Planctomycetota bacterium]
MDQRGSPIAGIRVHFYGLQRNERALFEYERDHGDLDWTKPDEQVTGADGRFEFRFWPPPPYQFSIVLYGSGRTRFSGHWRTIEFRSVEDLGDLVIPAGVQVTGRVVDDEGSPVLPPREKCRVRLRRFSEDVETPETRVTASTTVIAYVEPDGSFEFEDGVPEGRWKIDVSGYVAAKADQTVTLLNPDEHVQFVALRPDQTEYIRGVVVDPRGQPVHRARVELHQRRVHPGLSTRTRENGSFELARRSQDLPASDEHRIDITIRHDDFVPSRLHDGIDWGMRDLTIELSPALTHRVRVVR